MKHRNYRPVTVRITTTVDEKPFVEEYEVHPGGTLDAKDAAVYRVKRTHRTSRQLLKVEDPIVHAAVIRQMYIDSQRKESLRKMSTISVDAGEGY